MLAVRWCVRPTEAGMQGAARRPIVALMVSLSNHEGRARNPAALAALAAEAGGVGEGHPEQGGEARADDHQLGDQHDAVQPVADQP